MRAPARLVIHREMYGVGSYVLFSVRFVPLHSSSMRLSAGESEPLFTAAACNSL